MNTDRSLVRQIEVENPYSALIFSNTKARAHYVLVVLQRFGYDADELSADLSQVDRDRVLDRIRDGTLRFLVATDVAARGLDIPILSHVIQYEPPEETEAYIHRAGRTGRAGACGVAISLVNLVEKTALERFAGSSLTGLKNTSFLPTPTWKWW
jgi:ATP-dependent RNA helicase DeaD